MKKSLISFLSAIAMVFPLAAETVFTLPEGYTMLTIAAADTVGSSKLTAISASMLQGVEFVEAVSLGAYDGGTMTQKLNVTGVTWTANQWTTAGPESSPYLAYISVADDPGNADGISPAEEAFLIKANNTSGELTIDTGFDLSSRFPATTTIKIRKANTLDSFFGTSSSSFAANDLVYIWNGSNWDSFQYIVGPPGFWTATTDGFTDFGPITVIRPDEGVFVSRSATSDIVVTLFGEVPTAPQISTIQGGHFVASRFPVATTLADTGIANATWTSSDLLYIWNQDAVPAAKWDSYQFIAGSPGFWTATTDGFGSADNTVIPANSAMFAVRSSGVAAQNGGTTSTLPYTLD